MNLVECPTGVTLEQHVQCAVCGRTRSLGEMTLGFHDTNGLQAFACNSHFWDGSSLYTGWVAFIARQRWELLLEGLEGEDESPLG